MTLMTMDCRGSLRWCSPLSGDERRVTCRQVALSTVETVELLEDGYLLPAGDLEGFEAAEAPGAQAVDLLPKWDCYTMGYAPGGRQRFVHPDAQERV